MLSPSSSNSVGFVPTCEKKYERPDKATKQFQRLIVDNMNKTEPFDLLTENVSTVGKISRSAVRLDNYEIATNSFFGYSTELENVHSSAMKGILYVVKEGLWSMLSRAPTVKRPLPSWVNTLLLPLQNVCKQRQPMHFPVQEYNHS